MVSRIGMWWQKSRFHSWLEKIRSGLGWLWQKITQPWIIAIVAILLALIVVIILGYWLNWHWTGLVPETSEPKQHMKTLWDWLQLLVIPLILAIGGFWLNQFQKSRDERATEQRDKTEREIAADNQREAALQAYLDKMSELLLEKKLRASEEDDEIRKIARVRTLTVLRRLDPTRKASVIQFLHESGLIDKDECIISLINTDLIEANLIGAKLSWADLRRADLRRANLIGADLSKADLRRANLRRANLIGADLIYANLVSADLSEADLLAADLLAADLRFANLSRANLSDACVTEEQLKEALSLKGAIMPDGSKHS